MGQVATKQLFAAAKVGDIATVRALTNGGVDVNAKNEDGWSPLMTACYEGHLDVAKALIEAGANVNHTDEDNTTALYVASQNGHRDVVQALLGAGAVVNIATFDNGWNPVMIAIQNGHLDVVTTLVEAGATVIDKDDIHVHNEVPVETEQKMHEMKQQMEQQLHDMRQQMEAYQQQTQRAEERAIRAEQELKLSKQQAKAQYFAKLTDHDIPQNPDYLKSSWRVQNEEIQVIEGKPLGLGGWGEVREAMFRGMKVAAKFIHEAIISPHNIDLFIREMNIAACVRHPNLLLFIGASLDGNKPVIITELMQANLRSIIKTLSRDHVITIGTDVACALNYLHLMKPEPIIHRDVSSTNVLLEPIGSGDWRAKVSDYGSANFVSMVTTTGPGNASYAAPESSNPKVQSPKMDVYSYGILLLEMATGQFPDHKLQATRLKTLLWQKLAVLVQKCICEDPSSRIDMKDVLLILPKLNM